MVQGFLEGKRLLYGTWLVCVAGCTLLVLTTAKGSTIQYLNSWYNSFTVPLFVFLTKLGEILGFFIPFIYFLIFKPVKFQVGHIFVALLTLLLAYFFKHFVYPDAIRPIVYFEQQGIELINQSNITLNRKFSFPSGHTTAGFAYFFYAALCAEKKVFTMLFFITACLIGFSRVFLAQHFVIDVVAGSTLGVTIATLVYFFVIYSDLFKAPFLNKKLFNV